MPKVKNLLLKVPKIMQNKELFFWRSNPVWNPQFEILESRGILLADDHWRVIWPPALIGIHWSGSCCLGGQVDELGGDELSPGAEYHCRPPIKLPRGGATYNWLTNLTLYNQKSVFGNLNLTGFCFRGSKGIFTQNMFASPSSEGEPHFNEWDFHF